MCDLSDISIKEAYNAITTGESTNWMMVGYHDDTVISLLSYGEHGLSELRDQLIDEPWYGLLRLDDRFIFIDWMPLAASDDIQDRRKRHFQAVIDMFSTATHDLVHLTARTDADLDDAILTQLMTPQQPDKGTKDDRSVDDHDDDEPGSIEFGIMKDGNNGNQLLVDQQQHTPTYEELQAAKYKEQEQWELIKQQMGDAKKSNEALLVGYVSVKSDASPLWRRRYIIIQDHKLSIFKDNSHRTLVKKIPLDELARYGKCDPSFDCYITNAVVLETRENETWQLLADSRNGLDLIIVALDIVSNQ